MAKEENSMVIKIKFRLLNRFNRRYPKVNTQAGNEQTQGKLSANTTAESNRIMANKENILFKHRNANKDYIDKTFYLFDPVIWLLDSTLFSGDTHLDESGNWPTYQQEQNAESMNAWLKFGEHFANGHSWPW